MGRGAAPHPPGAASPLVLSLHKLQSQDGVGRAGRPLLCLHSWHQTYFYYGGRHHPPLGTGSEQQSFFLQNLPNHCYDQNKMTMLGLKLVLLVCLLVFFCGIFFLYKGIRTQMISQEHRGHQSSGARAPELWCPHIFFRGFLDGVLKFMLAVFQ